LNSATKRLVALGIIALVSWLAVRLDFLPLDPRPDLTHLGALFGTLLLASAILERALDVVLSLAFGAKADELDAQIATLQAELDKADCGPDKVQAAKLRDELELVRADRQRNKRETMTWALPMAVAIGVLMSAVGLRALSALADPASLQGINGMHRQALTVTDIVVTGMLLGGGSEGIHRIVALFRTWTDAKRNAVS